MEELNQALQAAILEQEAIGSSGTARGEIERQGSEKTIVDRPSEPPKAEVFKPAPVQTLRVLEHKDERDASERKASAKASKTSSEGTFAPSQTQRLPTHVLFLLGTGIGFSLTLLGTVLVYNQLRSQEQVFSEIQTLQPTNSSKCQPAMAPNLDANAPKQPYQCQLEYAKQLAASNKYDRAIAAANKIPKSSPLYPQAQALIQEWSAVY